jgi:ABC-2 type transport system permease protein
MFARARFRVSLVVTLTAILWSGMFWMFWDCFAFLQLTITDHATHRQVIGFLFGAFFFILMAMLVFSSGIILYSSLFRSREIAYLLTTPARTERVFLHKFQETLVLSSWGFVLLGSPVLLSFAIVAESPWYYYALLPVFVGAFIYIHVAIGAILCLWIVRRLPNKLTSVLVGAGGLLLLGVLWMAWGALTGPKNELLTPGWFQEVLGRLKISDQRLLPCWWLTTGLLGAIDGDWADSMMFLTLLVSNALFFRLLALWQVNRIYRRGYSGLYDKAPRRRHSRPIFLDRALDVFFHPLPATMRLIMIKDVRLFRRDPLQWSQFLIFLVLLVIYFFNIPHIIYDISSIGWVNMVGFLNLSVVGLLLSTFTTRFIYPMISLEGRRFWILGLLGVRRSSILWGKFLFAACGSILPCSALVVLSDAVLRVSVPVAVSHQLTCLVLCFGLAGIAVGFGAWLPNLREESPSRIASGFGGTLTLVVSTLYILLTVLLTALPAHFYLTSESARIAQLALEPSAGQKYLAFWWWMGIAASMFLGAAATFVPLRIGFRTFQRLEF